MRTHFDVLGWLYLLCGLFGVLVGLSLFVLALGPRAAIDDLGTGGSIVSPTVWFLVIAGALLAAGGVLMIGAGYAVIRRASMGRSAALVLAVPNLVVVPFGTALGIYTFWTLLNDDARREFGRPTRSPS